MLTSSPEEIAQLFQAWKQGDESAFERLNSIVYAELYRLARYHLQKERRDHTLQPTALINEVYQRLILDTPTQIQNRREFLGIAAKLMRRILVDYARRNGETIRHSGKSPLEEALLIPNERGADLIALDEALQDLVEVDVELARLVELRYFGGLTFAETAQVLQISLDSAKKKWAKAKTWLYHELQASD